MLVGATAAGPTGGEVLSALAVAVHAVPVEVLRHMIYAYPTFHRAIEDALRDLVAGYPAARWLRPRRCQPTADIEPVDRLVACSSIPGITWL